MLGLGHSITGSALPISWKLIETYTADWSSGVDGWASHSNNDSAATLTHGITFEGKSNALRVQFNADETGTGSSGPGIIKSNAFSNTIQRFDFAEVTCDIYLDSAYDALTDLWDGTDVVHMRFEMIAGRYDGINVGQNAWVGIDTTFDRPPDYDEARALSSDDLAIMFDAADDLPQNGARFYVHNYVAKLYRPTPFG